MISVVTAGSIAGVVGNPGEIVMVCHLTRLDLSSCNLICRATSTQVRLQGDFAKPPEKRFNYKHCFDALFRVSLIGLFFVVASVSVVTFVFATVFVNCRTFELGRTISRARSQARNLRFVWNLVIHASESHANFHICLPLFSCL